MAESELQLQQEALQEEASEVADELRLYELLSQAGEPVRVGSSAFGLMVWRDLDMTVKCSRLNQPLTAHIASELMLQAGVRELKFINDTGDYNTDPAYPDGFYIGLKYKSQRGKEWALDIWFVDEPEKQPDLKHIITMPERLTQERREAILRIKNRWASRAEYGKSVRSFDIYTAVLEENVSTPEQFEAWLDQRSVNKAESP
ncbi:hypothetical protein [Paenibacillus lautus]|uniref:Uncharacterized protein n=1 Tax=Paenibacillus lautus TaxID=1401 RepID=A0A385TU86_PAELA|nr:hypothetical protein [Paenibacillus lautus]AYB44735.1 hypothetical protein D5F53_16290 [Paenibacillus lautus]